MKRAFCCKCHRDLKSQVPDDATGITCFECNEREGRQYYGNRDRIDRDPRNPAPQGKAEGET